MSNRCKKESSRYLSDEAEKLISVQIKNFVISQSIRFITIEAILYKVHSRRKLIKRYEYIGRVYDLRTNNNG